MQAFRDTSNFNLLGDSADEIAGDLSAVARIAAVPTLLEVLCDSTGMGFAAVCRVTERTWTACAVTDRINFGLKPGGQLDVESTLCIEAKRSSTTIAIEHASLDPVYCNHHTTKRYRIESHVSIPIVLENGRYFGNLCAIDPHPALVKNPKTLLMFQRFADLIASQLSQTLVHEANKIALRDERAAGELRDQFIAILGHDLRNPLHAVIAASDLLGRKASDAAAVRDLAQRIKKNAKRMSILIDDVLDFARGKLGTGIGIKIDDVDELNDGLMSVVKELQDGHPSRQILALLSVAKTVRCDLGRIQQVISNLIGNALIHGATHRPVKVSAQTNESEFILEVWNEGEPIPSESLTKIFEPFWRHSTTDNRQGLGLGLYICSQIIRAHNGTLSVTSSRDEGTTFKVRLPLRPSPIDR